MTLIMQRQKAPDYGIDAPGLARFFLLSGLLSAGLAGVVSHWIGGAVVWVIFAAFGLAALYLLGMGGLMLYWSKIAKLRTREIWLDRIPWRGDEVVLDVGCGRGLMLVAAARRLTSGRAIGVDIWRSEDQSSNSPDGALENARLENVADRVAVETADMRSLPFEDGSFDVVLSHWAVHNLEGVADRKAALAEIRRVLLPRGTILLADIAHRAEYAAELRRLGCSTCIKDTGRACDALLGVLSFGSFQPFAIVARSL